MIVRNATRRRGAAAVEFAVVLPFLVLMFVLAVDWSRVFYYSIVVDNCARNGALYLSDPYATAASPYANLQAASQADAPNLSPAPVASSNSGSDTQGAYVDCTVTYTFHTVTDLPVVPSSTVLTRTVRVYTAPATPN